MPQPRFLELDQIWVDEELGASDEAGVVRGEEDGCAGNLLSITLLQLTYAAIKGTRPQSRVDSFSVGASDFVASCVSRLEFPSAACRASGEDSFTRSIPRTIRDTIAEPLSISLRKTGKRLHAICKPGLWPREVQSLPASSCIV